MFPFERPVRDLVLKGLDDDPETMQPLNDKELFTTALTRYLQLGARGRDMYRETLDDLMDFARHKKSFTRFPPKYREEGKYYMNRRRFKSLSSSSRLMLYKLRRWVLWELASYKMISIPRWPWQPIFIWNAYNLKRLQLLIAEFEDRCFQMLGRELTSRLEYDEVKHQLLEHTPKETNSLRDLKPSKLPERFILCLFHHPNRVLTYDEVYELMQITDKKDRRIPRWRKELRLDNPDLSGRFFHWMPDERIRFSPEYRYSKSMEEDKKL